MATTLINNNASTTLDGAIGTGDTTITLTSASGFPSPGAGEIAYATIDDDTNVEIISYTGVSTNDLTGVTRGVDGTSGIAFADGTTVEQRSISLLFEDALSADTSPELRGDLDVGSSSIVSSSNGDIAITPNGTGSVVLDGLNWPQADGTTDYVLKTDGAGQLSWTANGTGSGLADVVDDTTPQLGGNLDANTFSIAFDNNTGITDANGNEQIRFIQTTSAVNQLDVTNAATGNAPEIAASGGDANINLSFQAKGSGNIQVGNYVFDGDQTVGAGQDNYVLTYDDAAGTIGLEAAAGGGGGLSDVVDDTTPQLGGELELNGHYIDFGGSSSSTAYNLVSNAGIPQLTGAANYWWSFTSSSLYAQAGTSFNSIEFKNDSTRFTLKTNNSERLNINDSGMQLGAANARVTTILDEDTMSSDSATALATQQSIKAYVDSQSGGGGGVAVGKVIAMNYIMR